jgi:hypothetical protein
MLWSALPILLQRKHSPTFAGTLYHILIHYSSQMRRLTPYCNLVTMIAWYMFIIPELVKEAAVIFKALKAKMEKQEFI